MEGLDITFAAALSPADAAVVLHKKIVKVPIPLIREYARWF